MVKKREIWSANFILLRFEKLMQNIKYCYFLVRTSVKNM